MNKDKKKNKTLMLALLKASVKLGPRRTTF